MYRGHRLQKAVCQNYLSYYSTNQGHQPSSLQSGFSMPGNEASDKLHNFFEQDNSPQNPQSRSGVGLWPILNNNPWVDPQRHNGMPLNSNSKDSSTRSLDSERENGRQPSQMPFGANLNQFGLKPEFDKSHPRNQQLSLNGVMHGSQDSQARSKHAEFREDGMVSDRHSSMLGGFANFDSQQGNAPEYGSGHIRNSERTEVAKTPVKFDFLGNQQQLLRSQHLGMPPHSRQHPGFSDMQLWQQHLVHKQQQELQRQQQFQQLDQPARLQNSHNHLSVAAKPEGRDQLPTLLNGVPINDTSMHTWPNNIMGGESKPLLNSQKGIAGNLNWPQCSGSPAVHDYSNGVMFPNDQGQAMRSVEFVTQQLDMSLHGIPVSSNRISSNQYTHFQGMSLDCNDVMTKAGGNQVEKTSMRSAPFNSIQSDQYIHQSGPSQDCISVDTQCFQGKSLFGNASGQSLSTDVMSGDFQQVNYLRQNGRPQEFQDRKEQADLSHNLQKKAVAQLGPSCGVASLDPTEEKLLFGTGDDNTWDASFGSWSALVEDAVLGSSRDKGVQEEWNCPSFQKTEPSTGNHSDALDDNGKQRYPWDNDNLQNASLPTSKPFSLFNDSDSSSNFCVAPSFQHSSTRFAYERNDGVITDASQESFQQSFKEAKTKQFDPSHKQKQFVESDHQVQMHINDANNAALAGNTHEHSIKNVHSSVELNSRNPHGVWTRQQNVPLCNVSGQHSNKRNDWNANKSLVPSGDDTLKAHDSDSTKQYTQGTDTKRAMYAERDYDGSGTTWSIGGNRASPPGLEAKSDTGSPQIRTEDSCMGNFDYGMNSNVLKARHEMNQHVLNRQQGEFDKHAAFDSLVIAKGDDNVGKYQHQPSERQQTWDSSLNRTEKGSGETSDGKQEHPKVGYKDCTSNHSHHGQPTDYGDSERENSLSTGSEPHPLISVSEKGSGQAGRQTHHRFQHHPMGNLGLNMGPADSLSHTAYSQGLPHLVIGGFENQEQGYSRHPQFSGRVVSNNAMDMSKGQFTGLQRNIKETKEIQSRGASPTHNSTASASFGGSAAQFSQNSRIGQTSQNMLQLLHKVNQSRHNNNASRFGSSDHNTPSEIPEATAAGRAASRPQHNQSSSLQGFGLQLAPPSQWKQISNHVLPSQTSLHASNTRQVDPKTGDKDQTRSTSAASVQSPPLPRETLRRESYDNKSSELTCKGTSHLRNQGNSFADLSYKGNQLQKQQQQQLQQQHDISVAPGREVVDPSGDLSCGSQAEVNPHVKHASPVSQAHDSHDQVVTDKYAQTSVPSVTSRIPPSRLAPYADNHAPTSQFYSPDTAHSQRMDAGFYHPSSSGQQTPSMEKRLVLPSSATSGMHQQAGFSTMLRNVRANVSAQQRLSGVQNRKLTPDILRSIIMSKSDKGTNSWAPHKAHDQSNNEGSASADIGMCSINSQQFNDREEHLAKDNSLQQLPSKRVDVTAKRSSTSQGQESVSKHHRDGNSSVSISSMVRWHQQDISEGKYGKKSSPNSQTEQVPLPNVASSFRGIGLDGHTPEPSDQLQNCSLLQQIQATKGTDSDSSRRVGMRLKGAVLDSDASQMGCKATQRFIYGQNTVFGLPVDGELDETLHSSLPPDVKMLSFSSRNNEEISASTSSQPIGREVSSKDIYTSGQHDLQNETLSLNISSTSNFKGGSDCPQISPQMVPSWFERHGTYKKGQILDMYDDQRSAKDSIQEYFFPKVSESIDDNTAVDQRTNTDQAGSNRRSTFYTTMVANESPSPHLPSDIVEHNVVLRPKKRKSATSELLPWHKEVTHSSQRLQSISMAVLDWAQSTNRLIEKVEDEDEMIEDGLSMPRSRRRLILTTQLMQQLLPSVPAAVLAAHATSAYESVTYFVAKAALQDACSMIPYSRSNSRVHLNSGNMLSEKLKTSEKVGDHILSKVVEDSIGRSRKLEVDFLRLEKRANILDIRVECQELERFSIINRLGKFHGRSPAEGVESSSASGTAPRRSFPQRYVTALPMPGNLSDGVLCLSL